MKILIATDGSEFSKAAVEKICQITENVKNIEVNIVSVYEQPMMAAAAPYGYYAGASPALENEMRGFAEQAASQAKEQIYKRFPTLKKNITTNILCGSPKLAIVEEAENWGADLIVVGSHGYGFWERTLLGSVSGSIVNHAPCSVLVVRKMNHENNGTQS